MVNRMVKGKRSYSDRQEKLISKYLGWSQVTGSGSRPMHPGDIVSDEWLGECKTHVSPGHKIVFDFSVWDKLSGEAVSQFKSPALFVDDGSQTINHTFVMIELPNEFEIDTDVTDYSDKKSFRFDSTELFDSSESAHSFIRNGNKYCILWLPQFSSYLKYR